MYVLPHTRSKRKTKTSRLRYHPIEKVDDSPITALCFFSNLLLSAHVCAAHNLRYQKAYGMRDCFLVSWVLCCFSMLLQLGTM